MIPTLKFYLSERLVPSKTVDTTWGIDPHILYSDSYETQGKAMGDSPKKIKRFDNMRDAIDRAFKGMVIYYYENTPTKNTDDINYDLYDGIEFHHTKLRRRHYYLPKLKGTDMYVDSGLKFTAQILSKKEDSWLQKNDFEPYFFYELYKRGMNAIVFYKVLQGDGVNDVIMIVQKQEDGNWKCSVMRTSLDEFYELRSPWVGNVMIKNDIGDVKKMYLAELKKVNY